METACPHCPPCQYKEHAVLREMAARRRETMNETRKLPAMWWPPMTDGELDLFCGWCWKATKHGDHVTVVKITGKLALMHDACVKESYKDAATNNMSKETGR